jgi:hypothetical protein
MAAFALSGCGRPTDPPPSGLEPARLTVSANVASTSIATMVITVSGPGIGPSLVFNMEITPGVVAHGAIQVPAGSDRKLEIDAYDANQVKTHHGEKTISVVKPGGGNNPITIVLLPIAGDQPVTAEFGIYVVTVNPASFSLTVGGLTVTVIATVKDDKGNVIAHDPAKLQWATTDPSVFSVTSGGVVTGLKAGSGSVVAAYEGYAGTASVTVAPPTP